MQPCGTPVTTSGLVVLGVESAFGRSVAASLGERERRERRWTVQSISLGGCVGVGVRKLVISSYP